MTVPSDNVLVVDLGAQYARLIARRIREARVHSEIVPARITAAEARERSPSGIVLSGGPASVYSPDAVSIDPGLLDLGVPVLGICYGHQLIAELLGGRVAATGGGEFGNTAMELAGPSLLLEDLPELSDVWMSHRDAVEEAPDGFTVTARTPGASVAAMEDRNRGFYGVQFHPEVTHTPKGIEVLKRFLYDACGVRDSWTAQSIIDMQVRNIRRQIGESRAVCGLSGGVDSAVAAALVHRAIGDRLTCVFVDHGLLRQNEAEQVEEVFGENFSTNLIHVKAQERFLTALSGVTDPEAKRKIIGETFIKVFEEVSDRLSGCSYLVQGTLYPDVIESGGGDAAVIKSHHNVGGLPEHMRLELVEPLRDLFKDEVRAVGEQLGLPEEIVWRHPFPGPRSGDSHYRGGDYRAARPAAPGRRHRYRRDSQGRFVSGPVAGVRGPACHTIGGSPGGWTHLRLSSGGAGGGKRRGHDGGLGPASLSGTVRYLPAGDRRGGGDKPGALRCLLQASGHDRMGVR